MRCPTGSRRLRRSPPTPRPFVSRSVASKRRTPIFCRSGTPPSPSYACPTVLPALHSDSPDTAHSLDEPPDSERMLFFTSGAVESNIKGSPLPMPDKKPPTFRNAVVPRETAPAVVAAKPKGAVNAAGYIRR